MKALSIKLAIVGIASVLFALPASADSLLYDNGPIGNGPYGAWTFGSGIELTDSFTLAAASTLNTAQVGLWTSNAWGAPYSLDWSITTSPFGGTTVASGAAILTSTFVGVGYFTYDNVYESSFSLGGASLPAGAYWLQLANGTSLGGTVPYLIWDINNGPSQAFSSNFGSTFGLCGGTGNTSCSDSFQILGSTASTAPEPGVLLLLMTSALLAAVGFRRRKLSK